MRGLFDIDCS